MSFSFEWVMKCKKSINYATPPAFKFYCALLFFTFFGIEFSDIIIIIFAFFILSVFYNSSVHSMASKTDAKKIDIFKATVTGNVVRMQELIQAKTDLNQRNVNGATP